MKYRILTLALVGLFLNGCENEKTVTGPQGSQGPSGNPGPNTIQASFQNGLYPVETYSGETDTWLDNENGTTSEYLTTYRRVSAGGDSPLYSRTLVKFDVSALPANATVETVRLLMTTVSSSSLGSSSVTVGLHDMNPSLYAGSCIWTTAATWDSYNGSLTGWSNCDGDSTYDDTGMYQTPALSTVVFNSSYSGVSKVVEFSIPASVVQGWVGGINNGLVLISEGEFQSVPSANVDFYPYNAATATDSPELIVTYE